jgi:HlyD family secretion protein
MKIDQSQESLPQPSAPSRKFKRSRLGLIALLLLLGGGLVLWRVFTPSRNFTPPPAQALPPRPVETVSIKRGAGTSRIQLLGQVEANKSATLRSQVDGTVEQVLVDVGDRVKPGMVIATLDDTDRRLALSEAEAKLAQARSELARLEVGTRPEIIAQRRAELNSAQAREREAQQNLARYEDLVAAGALNTKALLEEKAAVDATKGERLKVQAALAEAISGPTREEIAAQQASVAAAVSAVNQAKVALSRTQVRATTGGIVRSREVSAGDLVENTDPLLTLVNGNELDVFLELPEQLSGSINPGQAVELKTRALPNWRGRATISGVVPAANAASRRQMVRVRLPNPPEKLLPKMAIAAEIQLQVAPSSFVVPRDALVQRDDSWLVYTVVDGKAVEAKVNVVVDMGETMAITGDQLENGQAVVVRGTEGLMPGMPVQVVEKNTKQES